MEKKRRRRSSELPDVIIQYIQSFLQSHEAARTMLVSKSWLRAWSTRPFLIFDPYPNTTSKIPSDVIDRTLESYVDQGIPIVRLCLFVDRIQERWLKMASQSYVIDLRIATGPDSTIYMFQEIFLIKSLQVLRIVSTGYINQLVLSHSEIKCFSLRKLQLKNVQIGEVTFDHIMRCCPLIQELLLSECTWTGFHSYNFGRSFELAGEYSSLKRLSLIDSEINDKQLNNILSKSPHLEDLNLIGWLHGVSTINLSSVTLKRVNLDMSNLQVVLVDAPNLHKLKFSSCIFWTNPFPITITRPITRGMVKVTIVYREGAIDESWFHRLKEFLAKFGKSSVKLTSYYEYHLRINFEVLRAAPLPPRHEVETLRFEWLQDLPFLYAFFTICHPKIVLLDRVNTICEGKLLMELLKDVTYRGNLECCNLNDGNKCWRHYIKDAELYYAVNNEKKPVDTNRIKTGFGSEEAVTLGLEWESSC